MRHIDALAPIQAGTPTPAFGPGGVGELLPEVSRAAWFAAGFIVVVLLGWYGFEPLLSRVVRRRNANNPTLQEALSRYTRLLFVLVGLGVGLGFAGYGRILGDSAIVIAAATLAIGVAGQSVLGSLLSGLVLVFDPEFNVGNYIEWNDTRGTVQSITLRVTRIQTPAGELVTIPNTALTSQAVTRPYGRGRFRVAEHVDVAYEDDVDDALAVLEDAAGDVSGIMRDPAPRAYVDAFGSDAVALRVHYWVERPDRSRVFAIRSDYARAAKAGLEAAGITIAPASKRELLGRIGVAESA